MGTYVFGFGLALKEGFDGFVLLVELGEVGDEVLDDVSVREGVDAGFVLGVCRDAAYSIIVSIGSPPMLYSWRCSPNEVVTYTNKPAY